MLRKWWMLSFYMYHLCMFQYMLQWTCLVCTWCITRCDVKKNLEMSIEYLKRATFIIKKEVGGRELTKLWVYSLVLPSQLRFPPNVFFPNFVRGGMVQSLDRCAMMGCPSFLFSIWQKKVKSVNAWTWNMFNRFPHSALREKVRVSHLHSVKKNSVNTRASWRSHSLRRMKCLNILICIYVIICLDIYTWCIYNELLCFTFVSLAYMRTWLTHIRSPRKVRCKPFYV